MKHTLLTLCLIVFALPSWGSEVAMKCHTSLWDATPSKNYLTYKFENNLIYPNKF